MILHSDPLGLAYEAFFNGKKDAYFTLYSSNFDPDDIPVSHFYRAENELPMLEKTALRLTKGTVLDVGAGSGVHSIILEQQGFDVTALDISPKAVEIMLKRGLTNAVCDDFFEYNKDTYDTILFLMNGIGLIQNINGFSKFFKQLEKLLKPSGQVLLDSSDLRYLFENEDGSFDIPIGGNYYGEVDFKVGYDTFVSEEFNWIYVDFYTLSDAANMHGFTCELIQEGDHYDFLARLVKRK